MEVPVSHLVCVDVLRDGLDLVVHILCVVQDAPMEVLVLLQTLAPVLHSGLELRVPVMSMSAKLVLTTVSNAVSMK
jgi:hypothetical protein